MAQSYWSYAQPEGAFWQGMVLSSSSCKMQHTGSCRVVAATYTTWLDSMFQWSSQGVWNGVGREEQCVNKERKEGRSEQGRGNIKAVCWIQMPIPDAHHLHKSMQTCASDIIGTGLRRSISCHRIKPGQKKFLIFQSLWRPQFFCRTPWSHIGSNALLYRELVRIGLPIPSHSHLFFNKKKVVVLAKILFRILSNRIDNTGLNTPMIGFSRSHTHSYLLCIWEPNIKWEPVHPEFSYLYFSVVKETFFCSWGNPISLTQTVHIYFDEILALLANCC